MSNKIKSHLVWACVCIVLFWPTAIPALLNAIKVGSLIDKGDIALAEEKSAKAKKWCKITTWIGAILWIINIVVFFVLLNTVLNATSMYY